MKPPIYYWILALGVYLFLALAYLILEKVIKVKSISIKKSKIFTKKVGAFWIAGTIVVFIYPILPW